MMCLLGRGHSIGILMCCQSASGTIAGTKPMRICCCMQFQMPTDKQRMWQYQREQPRSFVTVTLQEDLNAAAVARMVDMSLQEVADLLGGASSQGPGAEDSALLAKQVAQTLLELEAVLMTSSGKHAAKQSRSSENQMMGGQALQDMLQGLHHHASRYKTPHRSIALFQ